MRVPLLFSFWFMVAAYGVHCIDESLLGAASWRLCDSIDGWGTS